MRSEHIATLDLNLLPILSSLLEERHISRAAARVGLSQPAMSRALQRLRRQFEDELLIRGPNGYTLTLRAERIKSQLADVVVELERLYEVDTFEPATASRAFRIALSDYTFPLFGPTLARTMLIRSPNSSLYCEAVDAQVFGRLDAGSLDLVVFGRSAPEGYCYRELFDDRFVCIVAADHPAAGIEALTLAQYVEWPHLAIDIAQPGIETAVNAHGYSRRTVVRMPYHALAASVLPGTDLILTTAGRLASHFADSHLTQTLMAPRELGSLQFTAVWHPRLDSDSSHRWLREVLHDVSSAAAPFGASPKIPGVSRED